MKGFPPPSDCVTRSLLAKTLTQVNFYLCQKNNMNIQAPIGELQNLDWTEILTKYLVRKVLDSCINRIKDRCNRINEASNKKKPFSIRMDIDEIQDFLGHHYKKSVNWATEVSFRDNTTAKILSDIFIELDLLLSPRKISISRGKNHRKYPVSEVLEFSQNVILLGQPGAGKTTITKQVFLTALTDDKEKFVDFSFPLMIRLKEEFQEQTDIHNIILKKLGVSITFPPDEWIKERNDIIQIIASNILDEFKILLLLDGFDEISDTSLRQSLIFDLEQLALSTNESRFLLTSRTGDYDYYIPNTKTFEICPLTEEQIVEFSEKWLADVTKADNLLTQLRASPYWDTAIRPLTIAHLCALFERENRIPEKPKSIYKKIIQLLLEDWNNQRAIERVSQYGNFDSYRKYDFLSNLAYEITINWGLSVFNTEHIEIAYKILSDDFNLPKKEAAKVVKEIESHNGLIIQVGQDSYEFAHLSLQEYMVGDYITKLPFIPNDNETLIKIPNELAISAAISVKPSFFLFFLFIQQLKEIALTPSFINPFIERLNIEKPDFDNHGVFALTAIYLYSEFCRKYSDLVALKRTQLEIKSERDEHKLVHNTLKNVLSLTRYPVYKYSLRELKTLYSFIEVTLNPSGQMFCLSRFGKTILLKSRYSGTVSLFNNKFYS